MKSGQDSTKGDTEKFPGGGAPVRSRLQGVRGVLQSWQVLRDGTT